MTVKHMDNVGIVLDDIDAAIEFFTELGLDPKGAPLSTSSGHSPLSAVASLLWSPAASVKLAAGA